MINIIEKHTAEIVQPNKSAEKYYPWFLKVQNEGKVIAFALHGMIIMNQLSPPVQEYRQSLIRGYVK